MQTIDLVVVSLFDGISVARLALSKVPHLNTLRYYSYEIDESTIRIANRNFPQDESFRNGNVMTADFGALKEEIIESFPKAKILLIGGSPCQNFSVMGRRKGASTKEGMEITSLEQYLSLKQEGVEFEGQSFLFWEYIRAKDAISPDYFLLENVRVSKKWLPMFNDTVGEDGILLNSNTVSPQDRPRFYWTNIDFEVPKKQSSKGIMDVLEDIPINKELIPFMTKEFNGVSRLHKGIFNFTEKSKGVAQTTGGCHGCKYIILGSPNDGKFQRKLTEVEQERLQCLPDNYTAGETRTARAKAVGNAMTATAISHILSYLSPKVKS